MDGHDRQASDADDADPGRSNPSAISPSATDPIGPIGLSRRDFTRRVGVGSAAAASLVWAAPKVSTIRYAVKAAAGSPPPTSTTTSSSSTTVPVGTLGEITVSTSSACAGDRIHVKASGFAPKTAVTLEIDSAAHTLGVTTADGAGKINVQVEVPEHGLSPGAHTVKAVGVQTGGRTLSLSATITIKSDADCRVEHEGSTTTLGSTGTTGPGTTTASTPTTSSAGTQAGGGPGGGTQTLGGGGALAFTGTDAIDLALVGGAAAIGGRALYGLARRNDDDEDDE